MWYPNLMELPLNPESWEASWRVEEEKRENNTIADFVEDQNASCNSLSTAMIPTVKQAQSSSVLISSLAEKSKKVVYFSFIHTHHV